MEIDGFMGSDMVFEAGADAAGEGVIERLVFFMMSWFKREVIDDSAIGVLSGADVVEKGALVEIGHRRLGVPAEDVASELEHVVDIAGFSRGRAEAIVEAIGGAEVFVVAMAAGDVAVMVNDAVPEEIGGRAIGWIPSQRVAGGQADEFRDLGVGVFTGEDVFASGEGIEDSLVMKPPGEFQVSLIAGIGVEIGEGFVQAAMFAGEDFLHLGFVEIGVDLIHPVGEALGDGECLRIIAEPVGIAKTGEEFVQGIVWDPASIQVKAGGADVACGDLGIDFLTIGNGSDVSVAVGFLAFGEFRDHVIDAFEESRITRGCVGQSAAAEIVAACMARDSLGFPTAVMGCFRLEAGFFSEVGKEPVGLEAQEPINRDLLAVQENAREQADIVRAERPGLRRCGGVYPNGRLAIDHDIG